MSDIEEAMEIAFPPLSPWQPISTAPKDGTEVILGAWRTYGTEGWFHVQSDRWKVGESGRAFWRDWVDYDFNPTHWMPVEALPIPASPAADAAGIREALEPFAALGGPNDGVMPAYHDLDDDVVLYANSGRCITAGDVRRARLALGILHAPKRAAANDPWRLLVENVAACSEDDRIGVLKALAERLLATGSTGGSCND